VNVPDRNLGILLDDLLFEDSDLGVQNMVKNARQLYKVVSANKGIFDSGELGKL
jgi:hypothetical protein